MSCLAIIPARGGSKRIPRKNIKNFLGKPIISYSIDAAIKSNLFDEVMVSTEDKEISKIANNFGASIPFLRSKQNASDDASTFEVLIEVVNEYKQKLDLHFETVCCIYPCAPLLTSAKLVQAFSIMQNRGLDSIFPVIPFDFPIQKALKIDGLKPSFLYPDYKESRTQGLEERFHDAGQFYFVRTSKILKRENNFDAKTGVIRFSQLEVQDIDTSTDWKLAELKYKLLYG